MNRNPSGSLALNEALVGYLYFKTAEGLSDRSLKSCERILKKWIEYCGDVEIKSITSKDITKYLTWLRFEYVPKRFNGDKQALSPKTLRNIWIALSSFFAWASKEFGIENIKFRRQQPIDSYIVDFVSFELRLIIEVDGGQHAAEKQKDKQRDCFLSENGYRVLRFWNNEVLDNLDGVLEVIRKACLK